MCGHGGGTLKEEEEDFMDRIHSDLTLGAKKTNTRYKILTLIFIVTVLNYVDRATLSVAAPAIRQEFGIDAWSMGLAFSAFGWAYTALQLPGGWILDRWGPRWVYGIALIVWSGFTYFQGHIAWFANPFLALFIMRLLMGAAEAPAFPANSRLTVMWFPKQERGFATAVFSCAQYVALAVTPLMTWLLHSFGWEHIFYWTGVGGIAAGAIWLLYVRAPQSHKSANAAELLHIEGEEGRFSETNNTSLSWAFLRRSFSNRMLVGIYIGQFCLTTISWFFITWFPTYLIQEKGLSILAAGVYTAIPGIGAFIGGILGGLFSDWLIRRGHSLSVARKTPIILGFIFSSSIILGNYVSDPKLILAVMTLAFFAKGLGTQGWTILGDVSPKTSLGINGGVFNFCGNIASIITPIAIGGILSATGSFSLALIYVGVIALVGALSYLIVVGDIKRLQD